MPCSFSSENLRSCVARQTKHCLAMFWMTLKFWTCFVPSASSRQRTRIRLYITGPRTTGVSSSESLSSLQKKNLIIWSWFIMTQLCVPSFVYTVRVDYLLSYLWKTKRWVILITLDVYVNQNTLIFPLLISDFSITCFQFHRVFESHGESAPLTYATWLFFGLPHPSFAFSSCGHGFSSIISDGG